MTNKWQALIYLPPETTRVSNDNATFSVINSERFVLEHQTSGAYAKNYLLDAT